MKLLSTIAAIALTAATASAGPLNQMVDKPLVTMSPAVTKPLPSKAAAGASAAQDAHIMRNIGNTLLMLCRTFLPIPKDVIVNGQLFTPSFHAQVDFGNPVGALPTTGTNSVTTTKLK